MNKKTVLISSLALLLLLAVLFGCGKKNKQAEETLPAPAEEAAAAETPAEAGSPAGEAEGKVTPEPILAAEMTPNPEDDEILVEAAEESDSKPAGNAKAKPAAKATAKPGSKDDPAPTAEPTPLPIVQGDDEPLFLAPAIELD